MKQKEAIASFLCAPNLISVSEKNAVVGRFTDLSSIDNLDGSAILQL